MIISFCMWQEKYLICLSLDYTDVMISEQDRDIIHIYIYIYND